MLDCWIYFLSVCLWSYRQTRMMSLYFPDMILQNVTGLWPFIKDNFLKLFKFKLMWMVVYPELIFSHFNSIYGYFQKQIVVTYSSIENRHFNSLLTKEGESHTSPRLWDSPS